MIKLLKRHYLLVIVGSVGFMACKKNPIDLEGRCIEATGLAIREYCENTFLIQLPAVYGALGETIDVDNETYHRVVKIAGGNLTLYDGFSTGDRVFVKLRRYNSQTDQDLIASPNACLDLFARQFSHVPIYVVTAIGGEECQ